MLFEIPTGTKDFLPFEARWKKEIEDNLHQILSSWGYRQVITPTYEYLNTLAQGEQSRADYFSFFSEDGDTFALRNDFTTPIARLSKIALSQEPRPLRLYYMGNLFRLKRKERKREFWQAGAELIGDGSKVADAEVLALAMDTLEKIGMKNWSLDISHRGIVKGILEDSKLSSEAKKNAESLLIKKDYADLKKLVEDENSGFDLTLLPKLRGSGDILDVAETKLTSPKAKLALMEIAKTLDALKPYNYKQINIDLAMVKDFSYYTGMFFEAYAPGVARVICTGGRYDKLLSNFGATEPAVGFAIGIDEVMDSLVFQKKDTASISLPDLGILYSQENYDEAVAIALKKRQGGLNVFIALENESVPPAKEYIKI